MVFSGLEPERPYGQRILMVVNIGAAPIKRTVYSLSAMSAIPSKDQFKFKIRFLISPALPIELPSPKIGVGLGPTT